MPNSVIQPSFAGGELAPSLQGRVDINRYAISLKTCRNFYVLPYGGATNRAGTRYLASSKDSSKLCRLIPFTFSTEQTYVVELGDEYARFYRDGIQLQDGGGNPYEILSPFREADLALVKYVQSADVLTLTHPDYAPRELRRLADTDWEFANYRPEFGPFQSQNVDETLVITSDGVDGDVQLSSSAALFSSEMEGTTIRLQQQTTGDIKTWTNRAGVVVGDIRYVGERMYEAVELSDPSALTGDQTPVHTDGDAWDGPGTTVSGITDPLGVKWRYLHSGWGVVRVDEVVDEFTANVRVIKRLPDNIAGTFSTSTSLNIDGGSGSAVTEITLSGASADTKSGDVTVSYQIDQAIVVATGGGGGPGEPTTYETIYRSGTQVIDPSRYVIDTSGPDPKVVLDDEIYGSVSGTGQYLRAAYDAVGTGTYRFQLSAWDSVRGYPTCATYADQRLVFGGSRAEPQTIWYSETGVFTGFTTNIPLEADDAITITIASRQINQVRHLVPLNQTLALTSGIEWVLGPNGDAAISPDNISASAQNYRGASNVLPLLIGASALYVQAGGQIVRDLAYSFDIDGYSGSDLTIFSNHLFQGREVVDWTYAQEPDSVVWVVLDDGSLLSLTYVREQQVIAWARHDTKDGKFESVAAIREGAEDALYCVVARTDQNGNTFRTIERMASRTYQSLADSYFVDSGLTYDGRVTDGTTVAVAAVEAGDDKWKYPNEVALTFSDTVSISVDDFLILSEPVHTFEDGTTSTDYDDLDRVTVKVTSFDGTTGATARLETLCPEGLRDKTTGVWAQAATSFSGLDHLEGQDIVALADGNVEAGKTVSSGGFTTQFPAAVVHAGLRITADLETLPISSMGETVRDSKKNVTGVGMLLDRSRGVFAGRSKNTLKPQFYGELTELKQREDERWTQPTKPKTGYERLAIPGQWDRSANLFVRQNDPLPLTILAIIPEVTVGGKG